MLKIGVIGLGDIAGKAYLPVLASRADVELHLYTRNQEKLTKIGKQYRFGHLHPSLASLIESGVKGAFVHGATEAHFEILEQLLRHHIHVYVDKPITYDAASTRKLVELAERNGLVLMAGFNRRFAPAYQKLKEIAEPNMIVMQKNRMALPADVRTFIFDDFIHVVDTLRYLFPYPIERLLVTGRKKGDLLYHVTVQYIHSEVTAIGIMNRDSGTSEERLEVMSATEKRSVYNVSDVVLQQGRSETRMGSNDWEPTLQKRGFYQIVDAFIQAVATGTPPGVTAKDALETHDICERIVAELNML
jgi:virulence factor